MTNTPNYNLSIAESTDTVNLLTQCYPNFETIDTAMKANKDAGITTAVETKTGTNHAIVRSNSDAAVFRFVATSNYVAGDTFTIDTAAVTATTPDGQSLASGAFVINQTVLACLVGTLLTVFVSGTASVAEDSEKLGGELPAYYATAQSVSELNLNLSELENRTITKVQINNINVGSTTLINSFIPTNKKPFAFIRTGGTVDTCYIVPWFNPLNNNWYLACKGWADNALISSGTLDGYLLCI